MSDKKIVASYDYYTLDQAREIIYEEIRHNRAMQTFRENQKRQKIRKKKLTILKQKLLGLSALLVSIIEIFLGYSNVIDECAAFIILIPLGLGLLFTRKNVICND